MPQTCSVSARCSHHGLLDVAPGQVTCCVTLEWCMVPVQHAGLCGWPSPGQLSPALAVTSFGEAASAPGLYLEELR